MEFDPDAPGLSQAFLAASLGVEALIAGRLAYRAWNQKSPLWRAFVVPQIARNDLWFTFNSLLLVAYVLPFVNSLDGSCGMIRREALALRYSIGRKIVGMNTALLLTVVVSMQLRMIFRPDLPALISFNLSWTIVGAEPKTLKQAASALLQLTCDAVVELDEELRLTEHSNELAAMLLRDSVAGGRGGTLKGTLFTDLMPPMDAPPAIAKLSMFRSSGSSSQPPAQTVRAHAFHTRLVDSWSTKLRTEVLQDSKPFAVSRGATGDGEEAEELASVDSFPISPSSRHSEQWLPQSLYGRGMLFLDVDVERLCIHAASAPLMDLVGSAPSQVFPAPHTVQLLERIHSEGRLLLERGEQPPSKIYSFDEMPAFLGGATPDPITGTMHLIQAQLGLNVLVAFQPSVQVQNSNSSLASERRSSRRLASVHSHSRSGLRDFGKQSREPNFGPPDFARCHQQATDSALVPASGFGEPENLSKRRRHLKPREHLWQVFPRLCFPEFAGGRYFGVSMPESRYKTNGLLHPFNQGLLRFDLRFDSLCQIPKGAAFEVRSLEADDDASSSEPSYVFEHGSQLPLEGIIIQGTSLHLAWRGGGSGPAFGVRVSVEMRTVEGTPLRRAGRSGKAPGLGLRLSPEIEALFDEAAQLLANRPRQNTRLEVAGYELLNNGNLWILTVFPP
ncbi:hypothetical protein AK812_SmicGene1193 [Symbiodinium microadriaticum]|uniref:Uncharacterized protein n=1 Tax=Symbiodinium microadriaticum TaxID=2951 RepID=A0A1Q9F4P4_SYMMI|nr:hypothetical protein AK812_SmicGene1193 [Symbiodinium microadriaticum]